MLSEFPFCAPKAAAGPDSVASSMGLAQVQSMVILEFQGTCTVDQLTTASGSSASAATPSIAVHAGDFLVAAGNTRYNDSFQPSAGFTLERGPGNLVIADSPQSAAGNSSVTFTLAAQPIGPLCSSLSAPLQLLASTSLLRLPGTTVLSLPEPLRSLRKRPRTLSP